MKLWEGRILRHTKVKRHFIKSNEKTSYGATIYYSKDGKYKTFLYDTQEVTRVTSVNTKF